MDAFRSLGHGGADAFFTGPEPYALNALLRGMYKHVTMQP